MATTAKLALKWYSTRSCWRKTYKGKTYYLATKGKCKGPDDVEGYSVALAEFMEIMRRVDGANQDDLPPAKVRSLDIDLPSKHVASYHDYSSDPDELPLASLSRPANVTLSELVDAYVEDFKSRAQLGDCSISTYRESRDTLADFKGYAAKYKRGRMEEIDEHLLKCYRDRQRELVLQGEYSAFTAKKRLANLKRFLEWAYKHRYLDSMPRNVDRHYARVVKLPDPAPQPFNSQQVKALWKAATTKEKFSRKGYRNALYILLGLNCGYRSKDIATLKHSHLRKEGGFWVIERKREKTGSPQVHKLWPLTYQLLMEEATDPSESEIMLLDERGGLLVVESMENKTGATDCIGRSYNRNKKKAGISGAGTGHSVLRDTGADAIKKHFPETPHIVSQYLGHKPKGMHTHYAREHYELLFSALDWLDGHFGLKL